MAGALEPDRGSVHVDGSPVGDRPEAAALGVAVVPQGNGLAAVLTAYQNIGCRCWTAGCRPARRTAEHARRSRWSGWGVGGAPGGELSGGQQQRVAVAGALAARASVLLADVPTSDLDGRNREVVLTALRAAADRGAVVVWPPTTRRPPPRPTESWRSTVARPPGCGGWIEPRGPGRVRSLRSVSTRPSRPRSSAVGLARPVTGSACSFLAG